MTTAAIETTLTFDVESVRADFPALELIDRKSVV